MTGGLIILIIPGILLLFIIMIYNSLVTKKNYVQQAFSSIDVMLQRRYDLIPNLVATVRGYMNHEADILAKVTALRANAESDEERVKSENEITKSIGQIMITAEDYPDLKASDNFMNLQRNLTEAEEQLSASRRFFNAAVIAYNNSVETFPSNLIASMMNYKRKEAFVMPDAKREDTVPRHID